MIEGVPKMVDARKLGKGKYFPHNPAFYPCKTLDTLFNDYQMNVNKVNTIK
jgi:hypothetical protein